MPESGWHRADIVAAIHKRGTSLRALARQHGKADSTLRAALQKPRGPSNLIIADFLGRTLHELWPQWFDRHGRLRPQREGATRPGRPSSQKRSAA
jgi:Ner family transcriptional regulator